MGEKCVALEIKGAYELGPGKHRKGVGPKCE